MFVKKAFSSIASKLPRLLKTLTSKLPSTISSVMSSGGFSQALNFLKSNQAVPQSVQHVAKTLLDDRFLQKVKQVGSGTVGMAGTAMIASSLLGPQAGVAVQAVGIGKDLIDLYKGYRQVDQQIRNQQNQRKIRANFPKIQSVNPRQAQSYQNMKTKQIQKKFPKIKSKPIGGYVRRY